MTTTVETTNLPSLAPPDDGVAHLSYNGKVAHCGATVPRHLGHGRTATPCSCGAPLCPTCLDIARTFGETGCWEGAGL